MGKTKIKTEKKLNNEDLADFSNMKPMDLAGRPVIQENYQSSSSVKMELDQSENETSKKESRKKLKKRQNTTPTDEERGKMFKPEDDMPKTDFQSSSVDPSLISYLISLAESLNNSTHSDNLGNLEEQCIAECESANPFTLFSIQDSCIAVETIGQMSRKLAMFFLRRLLTSKRRIIRKIIEKNIAARCIENLLYKICDEKFNSQSSSNVEAVEIVAQFSQMAIDEIDGLCMEYGGSHFLRSLGRIYCGLGKETPQRHAVADLEKSIKSDALLSCYKPMMESLLNFVLDWKYIHAYIKCETVSLLLQDFIELSVKYTKTHHLAKFIDDCLEADHNLVVNQVSDKFGSRVYEKLVLNNQDGSKLERLIDVHFRSAIKSMCLGPFSNFVVQRLFEKSSSEEMFDDLYDEISPSLDEIWAKKKLGVICSIVNGSVKTNSDQKAIKKDIFERFGCTTSTNTKNLIVALLYLKPIGQCDQDPVGNILIDCNHFQLQGSLLIQALLKMRNADELINGIISLKSETIIEFSKNSTACHVIEAFFGSKSIKTEQKLTLFNKIKGHIHILAIDKFGSRVLESLWNNEEVVDENLRCQIASILLKKETVLTNDFFGRIIWFKFGLKLFKADKTKWLARIDAK